MISATKLAFARGLVTVALTVGCVLVVGIPTLRRILHDRRVESRVFRPIPDSLAYPPIRNVIGSSGATVTIIEFRDYACAFCAAAQPLLDSIISESQGRVAVSVRHLPVRSRAASMMAAVAAECSAGQSRLREYAGHLWAHRARLDSLDWLHVASEAGVADIQAFSDCMATPSAAWTQLAADSTIADHFEVQGTPTFVIGKTVVSGLPTDRDRFRLEVARALAGNQ